MRLLEFYQQHGRAVVMSWAFEQIAYDATTDYFSSVTLYSDLLKAGVADWECVYNKHDDNPDGNTALTDIINYYHNPDFHRLNTIEVEELRNLF